MPQAAQLAPHGGGIWPLKFVSLHLKLSIDRNAGCCACCCQLRYNGRAAAYCCRMQHCQVAQRRHQSQLPRAAAGQQTLGG